MNAASIPLAREDRYGSMRLMCVSEGYVMARRKGGIPFVVSMEEWIEIGDVKVVVPIRLEKKP